MAGATPFLRGLLDAAAARGTSLPGLRRFICGGASVPPELIHRALDALPGTIVSRAYGSTEVPLACPGVRNREEAKAHADTDGRMALDLQILDAAGRPAAEGEDGEIAVRGPQMFIGYLDPGHEAGCDHEPGDERREPGAAAAEREPRELHDAALFGVAWCVVGG